MEKRVELQVRMRVKDMYLFLLRHSYFRNPILLILAVGLLVVRLISGWGSDSRGVKILLFLILAFLLVFMPFQLFVQAVKQAKLAERFQEANVFVVSAEGIRVTQGEQTQDVSWDMIFKTCETKQYFYVYLAPLRAFIFPKDLLGEQSETFRELLSEYAPKKKRSKE